MPDDQKVASGLFYQLIDFVLSVDATILVVACALGSFFSFFAVIKLSKMNIDFSYFDDHISIKKFVANREKFTILESSCLLAGQKITTEEPSGVAAGYLHTIRSKILDHQLKPLNVESSEHKMLALQKSMNKYGGSIEGIMSKPRLSIEISKSDLQRLAREFDVEIPGL